MKKVLVLEDEPMIGGLLEDILIDMNIKVVGPYFTVDDAISFVDLCDAAILDVNLGAGQTSFEVAKALLEKSIPFCFVTGYPEERTMVFPQAKRLGKPIDIDLLESTIREMLGE